MNAIDMPHSVILLDWQEAARLGSGVAGGKGAQLGRLARYGLPVGDGCVIPVDAHRAMMSADMQEAALRACTSHELTQSAELEQLRQRILAQPLPPALSQAIDSLLERKAWQHAPLAIRSSAPSEDSAQASFAGIHRSVLNVIGRAAVADAIRAVWASLWTPQAVAYRERIGMSHADAAMAVVIMPMAPAKASGVIFTCDPRSGREDRMVISGVRGLGEALVSGLVAGEDIILGRDCWDAPWGIMERRRANATLALEPTLTGGVSQRRLTKDEQNTPVLDDTQAVALGMLALDAASALDFSAPWYDIEWVWDGCRFHLVQARPITVRPWHTYPGLQGQAAIWSNGNTREVMPHVVDASGLHFLNSGANALLQAPCRLAGFPLLPGAQRVTLIQGRAYLNVSFLQWEAYSGFGVTPTMMNRALGGHQPEISVSALTLRQKLTHVVRKLRLLAKAGTMRRQGLAESQHVFDASREWRKTDLHTLTDQSLIALADNVANVFASHPGMVFMQGFSGSVMELLERLDRKFPGEGNSLAAALMAGGTPSPTAQQGYDLLHLASLARNDIHISQWLRAGHEGDWQSLPSDSAFRAAFADFLDRYGHRGVYESYLRTPRWREAPSFLLTAIAGLLETDVQDVFQRQKQAVASAWLRIGARLSWAERWTIRILLPMAKRESNQRELARSAFTALSERGRSILLEIGRRLVARGLLNACDDVFHLIGAEQTSALRGALTRDAIQARIADRRAMAAQWDAHPAADVVIEGGGAQAVPKPKEPKDLPAAGDHNTWRGVAVGSGYIQGTVRIVTHPNEQARLQCGDILVAPSTDPSWVPLFLKAGGLIMETGGYLSHGAIVAREFGIPAVVNLPGIMAQLQDGEMVAVDGQQGVVVRLGVSEPDNVLL